MFLACDDHFTVCPVLSVRHTVYPVCMHHTVCPVFISGLGQMCLCWIELGNFQKSLAGLLVQFRSFRGLKPAATWHTKCDLVKRRQRARLPAVKRTDWWLLINSKCVWGSIPVMQFWHFWPQYLYLVVNVICDAAKQVCISDIGGQTSINQCVQSRHFSSRRSLWCLHKFRLLKLKTEAQPNSYSHLKPDSKYLRLHM